MNISLQRTKTGILAIAAAGIFAAGAVADRANRLYSPTEADGASTAGDSALAQAGDRGHTAALARVPD